MQQVEAPVGKHDRLARSAPLRHALGQPLAIQHLLTAANSARRRQRRHQFMPRNRHRAHLAHHDPRRQIRQLHRRLHLQPARQRRSQRRNHRIARARHIEHLARPRRRVIRRPPHSARESPSRSSSPSDTCRSCSLRCASPALQQRRQLDAQRTPVASASSPRFGHTIVAPEYLPKSGVFGSASTGIPACRAAANHPLRTTPPTAHPSHNPTAPPHAPCPPAAPHAPCSRC